MRYLRIKNYERYQHYKDRNPPWIKLYREVLNDYELRSVPVPSRLAYIYCLILASESDNRIPFDVKFLSERCGFEVTELVLSHLIRSGFLIACGARRLLAHDATSSNSVSVSSSDSSLPESESSDLRSESRAGNGRDYHGEAIQVLEFLNEKTQKHFRPVSANLDLIQARLKSGVDVQTCKTLIARKVRDWTPKPEMAPFLRPETLFGKTKFETYLAEVTP